MFENYKPLKGRKWLRQLTDEDRKVFGKIGYDAAAMQEINLNKIGGKARAKQAKRYPKGMGKLSGRFIRDA